MSEPGEEHRDRSIAPLTMGAVFVAVIVVGVLWQRDREPESPPPAPPAVNAAPQLKTPPPERVLDRQGLIQIYQRAIGPGEAFDGRPLVGARLDLTLPFQCEGAQGTSALRAELSETEGRRSLTLSARPTNWTSLPLVQQLPEAARPEYVEGFWISRPWIDGDGCPTGRTYTPSALPTPGAAETLGMAIVAGTDAARTERHADRPYQVTRPLDGGALDAVGYRLRIEGEVAAFPDGEPVKCWAESPDHRPVCIVAVSLERVSILDSQSSIATWPRMNHPDP